MEFILLAVGALYLFAPKLAWKWGRFNYNNESNAQNKDLEKMTPSKKTIIYLRVVGSLLIAAGMIFFIN
ncbi:hypothetical protein [Paenibacillus sp. JDR-2]|uniref:hypothetical protein n=1 Tax=Paenibacillus sp. (strain JDR-2) TaxID=324057 RepID=UPI0001668D0B|nr:hypothetical protein [Paenibacillus sp. JDR-2]ACT03320.1 hypothetical protein Pjdr2_4706 [Paenibacillus sp. JDR-2]